MNARINHQLFLTAAVWLVTVMSSSAQQSIVGYEYWYDDDHASALFEPTASQEAINVNTSLPTAGLQSGIHLLHFRAKDDLGMYSSVKTHFFLKVPETPTSDREIVAYEYWFNANYTNAMAVAVSSDQTVTLSTDFLASMASNGMNQLHVRFKDSAGQWSSVVSRFFLKTPETPESSSKMVTYRYWIGSDIANAVYGQFSPSAAVVQLTDELDMTALSLGEHAIHFQHQDDAGRWSVVMTDTFERAPITVDVIENEPENGLALYPNPTSGELTLTVDGAYNSVDLRITDLHGRMLRTESYGSISTIRFMLNQPAGTYLLEILTDNDKRSIFRVIKN